MYFECNLPRTIPAYYAPEICRKLQDCVNTVYRRTEKLNEACDKMQAEKHMRPATFHALAKKVFDNGSDHFDQMSIDNLCTLVGLLYTGEEYPDREEFPNVDVMYDTAFVSTKDWEALRHFGIGGSDSSVLMGVNPYQTEEGLYFDKLGFPERVKDEGRQAIFDRGHFLEPKVIETFCNMTGAVQIPETRMFRSRKHPASTANLDAVLRMPSGKLVIFEAKSAIDCYTKAEEWFGSNIPPNYVTQIHQYMGVMDDPRIEGVYIGMLPCTDHVVAGTYIGSAYNTDKYFHQYEARDEVYEEEILQAEEDFWKNHVEAGVKPAPSMNAALDRTVNERYKPTPKSVESVPVKTLLYEEYKGLYERLLAAEEQVKTKEKEFESISNYRDTIRNEIIELMDGAQEAQLTDKDGAPMVTIKNTLVRKESIDIETLKQFFGDAYEKCRRVSVFTRFSTKPYKPKKK